MSKEPAAYEEIADWLQVQYRGYQVDFVFNPKNTVILDMLRRRGAAFYPEQFKMVLTEASRSSSGFCSSLWMNSGMSISRALL